MVASGGTGAVDAVLLASAVVPPLVVLLVCRVAWLWAKRDDEQAGRVDLRAVLREALWLRPRG